jgi:hypothetical protein
LLNLERDIKRMAEEEPKFNEKQQKKAVDLYYGCNPTRDDKIAAIKFAMPGIEAEGVGVQPLVLGPYEMENRLEVMNRLWDLLKYFRSCRANG